MARTYLRWMRDASPDLASAMRGQLCLTRRNGTAARTALWVFTYQGVYKPSRGVQNGRTLVAVIFTDHAEQGILENPQYHKDFEDDDFAGEAGHPNKIIIKNNEQDARGIGAVVLKQLNDGSLIQTIRIATPTERAWALR